MTLKTRFWWAHGAFRVGSQNNLNFLWTHYIINSITGMDHFEKKSPSTFLNMYILSQKRHIENKT